MSEKSGALLFLWISYVFACILPLQSGSAGDVGKVGGASLPMDFLCICMHSASPEWLCRRCRKSRGRFSSYGFPMYLHAFCLSRVALQEMSETSGAPLFLWISYVFACILPLQSGSAGDVGNVGGASLPMDFLCICMHSA